MDALPSEIRALLELCDGHAELLFSEERERSDPDFRGADHTIALRFAGREGIVWAEALICELPRRALKLGGTLVAELSIVSVERGYARDALETTIVLAMSTLESA